LTSLIEPEILSARVIHLNRISVFLETRSVLVKVRVTTTKKMASSVERKRIKRRILSALFEIGKNRYNKSIVIDRESRINKILCTNKEIHDIKNDARLLGEDIIPEYCIDDNVGKFSSKCLLLKIIATRAVLYTKYHDILFLLNNIFDRIGKNFIDNISIK